MADRRLSDYPELLAGALAGEGAAGEEPTGGLTGYVHAVDLADGREAGSRADEPVVMASVFKVPVLVEMCRQAVTGELDFGQRVRIPAGERRTMGPTGLSVMLDDVEVSLRDLALMMMSVSDNRATDLIVALVGLERINATVERFGLTRTRLEYDCEGIFDSMRAKLGGDLASSLSGNPSEEDLGRLRGLSALTAETTNRSTPRETTALLSALWRDGSGIVPAEAAAEVRRIMGLQAWGHRMTAGFPEPGIRVSGKTGTLTFVRNEVGVVEYPDGGTYAVAVYLRDAAANLRHPAADAAIGRAARLAVDLLRGE